MIHEIQVLNSLVSAIITDQWRSHRHTVTPHQLSEAASSPPGPAARFPSGDTSWVQKGCAGTAWTRGVCSTSPPLPPPSPRTSPTCRRQNARKDRPGEKHRTCRGEVWSQFHLYYPLNAGLPSVIPQPLLSPRCGWDIIPASLKTLFSEQTSVWS